MAKKFFTRLSAIAWVACFSVGSFAQNKVDLTEGTLFLSGGLSFKYDLIGFEKPQHNFALLSDIGGGYFLYDGIAVGLSIPGEWNFASGINDIAMDKRGKLGLKLFSTYYFNIESPIAPYVGLNVTPAYSMGEKAFQLSSGIDTGVLVSLSQSVALDFGIRPELYFKLFETQKWRLSLPAGFLGIKAVF